MKEENQIIVISGFLGFGIGVILMLMVSYHNEVKLLQKYEIILENVVEEVYKHEGLYEYQNMYKIEEKIKQGKSLYTVVYSYGQLTLPVCQSKNYQDCVDYIDKQPKETKVYNKEESQQALNKCLNEMYKKNSNPD